MGFNQEELVKIAKSVAIKNPDHIKVDLNSTDIFGRKLQLDGRFLNDNKKLLNEDAKNLLGEIQDQGSEIAKTLKNEIMWYDIRSLVWREHPELSVLFALSYAKILCERTRQKDGHIINIAVDNYSKHFETMSVFSDTLIRTGITQNGGGVIYWGVQNGGAIRNLSQYQLAKTKKGGHWVYGTMSHRQEDFVGAKFGMQGKVFCGKDLMEDFYSTLIKADFSGFIEINNPSDFLITVSDITQNNIALAESIIRARTGTEVKKEELLKDLKLSVDMLGSPIGKNLVEILTAFGADLKVINSEISEFTTDKIIDPNEHESESMEKLKKACKEDGRIHLAVDPDGDRGTIIALNTERKAISLTGTELLILATENLVTYNPQGLPNDIIYDMRTGVSIKFLADALKKENHPVNIIASEPGYPFFMQLMSENENAAISVENTNHAFLTPFTNPIWGAPVYYPNIQGGDDAALFLVYLLSLAKHKWQGRNPIEQLDWIRKNYQIPPTIIKEFKPALTKENAAFKYDIAKKMCDIVTEKFGSNSKYKIDTMNSGARITDLEKNSMVLMRYSNTGPAFTVSGEAINEEDSEKMYKLGAAVMFLAVLETKKEKSEFEFEWKDFESYGNISTEEAVAIISQNQ